MLQNKCFPPITASTVISASFYTVQNTSAVRCEEFLQFFTSKVRILGAAFPLCDSDSFACLSHLTCLVKMISSMKTTTWALDTVSSTLLKDTFNIVDPSILSIMPSRVTTTQYPHRDQ